MSKVWAILAAVLAFGWLGVHLGRVYAEDRAYGRPDYFAGQLGGGLVGALAGAALALGLVRAFTAGAPEKGCSPS